MTVSVHIERLISVGSIDPALGSRLDTLAERLVDVAGELDDLTFDLLRQAVADGAERPPLDRELQKVRRSLDKAIGILRSQTD